MDAPNMYYADCRLCGEHTGYHLYSCRVCGHAYHTECLKAAGNLQTGEEERRMLTLCSSRCGWSCHVCVCISLVTLYTCLSMYVMFMLYTCLCMYFMLYTCLCMYVMLYTCLCMYVTSL